jgi:hypothetical protein
MLGGSAAPALHHHLNSVKSFGTGKILEEEVRRMPDRMNLRAGPGGHKHIS